tara:strand:- start:92 stop:616 length:525 start_codon:yes stop_codon:yes gene_type:complete
MLGVEVQKAVSRFGKSVVKESKRGLQSKGKLHQSIRSDVKKSKNSVQLSFSMEEYGAYVDKGVKGAKDSSLAPRSPFRFGTGNSKGNKSMSAIMTDWVKTKGFQWKDKSSGQFMSHKQMGFIIARSKYNKGTRPSMFFTKPFEAAFKRLPDELIKNYGLDVEKLLNKALKNIKE